VYLWKIGAEPASAVRLTFHTANDRWPDIFISQPKKEDASPAPAPPEKASPGK
jgi:hypothetical protein